MAIRRRNGSSGPAPEPGFRRMLSFLSLPYDPATAVFFATNRINSSFGHNSPGVGAVDTLTEPWAQWDEPHKRVFIDIAKETMVSYGIADADELVLP